MNHYSILPFCLQQFPLKKLHEFPHRCFKRDAQGKLAEDKTGEDIEQEVLLNEYRRGADKRGKNSCRGDIGLFDAGAVHQPPKHDVAEHTVHRGKEVDRFVGGIYLGEQPVVIGTSRYFGSVYAGGHCNEKNKAHELGGIHGGKQLKAQLALLLHGDNKTYDPEEKGHRIYCHPFRSKGYAAFKGQGDAQMGKVARKGLCSEVHQHLHGDRHCKWKVRIARKKLGFFYCVLRFI